MKRAPMNYARWLRLMRDGRPMEHLTKTYKMSAVQISSLKRGVNYKRWHAELIASGETPAAPGSVAPEPPREPHWSITQPWGRQHTPETPVGYYGEVV